MNLPGFLLKMLAPQAKAFEESTKDPIKYQKKVLLEFLSRNKKTKYGRRYNFDKIHNIADYQRAVPVTDYEKLRPVIDRMAEGENNILTADKPTFFAITSGTTGKPKLIPVTDYSREKKAEVMKLWSYYVYRDHAKVIKDKILAIISPEVKSHTPSGIAYGPEDGHAYNNLPSFIKKLYVLPYELFYIEDYDARYYCMLRISMEHKISTIATLNPSTLVLLCQRIDREQENIIRDIEKGTLDKKFKIETKIRKKIEAGLKPNPKRAKELRDILKRGKPLVPKYFWPGLDLIECWKGGTVKLYLKQLPQYFGDVPIRDFGCLSTEARSSIPMSDDGAGGVLSINSNFYEFLPKEDMNKKVKKYLLCDQVEKGKEYFLIVTTPAGLYRYNIDDVIVVRGFLNKTPIIEFVQKGRNAISLTGEKIYESHVSEAVTHAVHEYNTPVDFFAASVELGSPGRYVFLAEFHGEPELKKKKEFLKCIEEQLCRINSEYKDIREQQLLGMPVLKVVKRGEFEKYRAKRIAKGSHDGQFKMSQLVLDKEFEKNFIIEETVSA